MGSVCWQPALDQYREIIRVESMKIISIDRHDRPVGVSEDRTAPDMVPTGQLWRSGENLEGVWIDPFHPSEWWRPAKCSHCAAHIPLPSVALDCHDMPFVVVT
jgi:hypothetical protein